MADKEIIIDGVDVAECEHFWNIQDAENLELCKINFDNNYFSNGIPFVEKCKEHNTCYYKQLKRLEQENEKLKEENKDLKIYIESNKQQVEEVETLVMDNARLLQALEEIRDIINQPCSNCKYNKDDIACIIGDCGEGKLKIIENKINEVLK